jgi:hypothetical protein
MLAFLFPAPSSSQALGFDSPPGVNPHESLDEPFEELEEAGEEEVLEQEAEESEVTFEEFEEEEGEATAPPSECLLRTVSARVFTYANREQVSLVLGYTSSAPVNATVDYRLKGGKGALSLGKTTHQLSRQGVIRVTEKLNESQMAKVKAAKDFSVRVRVLSAPSYCRSYFTRRLNVKRKVNGQVVWRQAS